MVTKTDPEDFYLINELFFFFLMAEYDDIWGEWWKVGVGPWLGKGHQGRDRKDKSHYSPFLCLSLLHGYHDECWFLFYHMLHTMMFSITTAPKQQSQTIISWNLQLKWLFKVFILDICCRDKKSNEHIGLQWKERFDFDFSQVPGYKLYKAQKKCF